MQNVAIIKGDGIGPEVIEAALSLAPELHDRVQLHFLNEIGPDYFKLQKKIISDENLISLNKSPFILLGAFTTPNPRPQGYQSIIGYLRTNLKLSANIRPFKSINRLSSKSFDLVIFRENTEDLYYQKQYMRTTDVAVGEKVISRSATETITKNAFDYARMNGKRKITIVTKSNVLHIVDDFFRQIATETLSKLTSKTGYEVQIDQELVDAAAYHLVKNPSQFEIILTPNLYGDILSDLMAGMSGSLGLCPSINQGDNYAMFEPIHGSALDIAGKGIANPTGTIFALISMLNQMGFKKTAAQIGNATDYVLNCGELTPDLGGKASTSEFVGQISSKLRKGGELW